MDIIEKKLKGNQVGPQFAEGHKHTADAQIDLLTYQITLRMLAVEAILETVELILRTPMITMTGLGYLLDALTEDVPVNTEGRNELLKIVRARKQQGF